MRKYEYVWRTISSTEIICFIINLQKCMAYDNVVADGYAVNDCLFTSPSSKFLSYPINGQAWLRELVSHWFEKLWYPRFIVCPFNPLSFVLFIHSLSIAVRLARTSCESEYASTTRRALLSTRCDHDEDPADGRTPRYFDRARGTLRWERAAWRPHDGSVETLASI